MTKSTISCVLLISAFTTTAQKNKIQELIKGLDQKSPYIVSRGDLVKNGLIKIPVDENM